MWLCLISVLLKVEGRENLAECTQKTLPGCLRKSFACRRLCLQPAGLRPQELQNENLTHFFLFPLIPFPGILVPACLFLGFGGLRFFFFARGSPASWVLLTLKWMCWEFFVVLKRVHFRTAVRGVLKKAIQHTLDQCYLLLKIQKRWSMPHLFAESGAAEHTKVTHY